jgi:hypothetical protein
MVAKLKQLKDLAVKGLKIKEKIHTESLVASFEAKVDMHGASAEAKAAYDEGNFHADGKAHAHSKGEAGAEVAAEYEADGLRVKGQGSASVADGAQASIDAGYKDKGENHEIEAKGHADTSGDLSSTVSAAYEKDEWKLQSDLSAGSKKGLGAEIKATYEDANEKAEAAARYSSRDGSDGELSVESKSEHVTVSGRSKIDDEGNVEGENKVKVDVSDQLQVESVLATGTGGTSFGGSVLFNAGQNATLGASATAHSVDGLSTEASMMLKGDGVKVEGTFGYSDKAGAKGEIDLTFNPNDYLEIGAHVKGSEIAGVKYGGHLEVKPSKNVSFAIEGEGDDKGNTEARAGLKIKF